MRTQKLLKYAHRNRCIILPRHKYEISGRLDIHELFSFLGLLLLNLSRELVDRLQEDEDAINPKKIGNLVKKIQYLLRLTENLTSLMCDSLGEDFSDLTSALSVLVVLNDASVMAVDALPQETRHGIAETLPALAQCVLEELLTDQAFATFVLSERFEVKEDDCVSHFGFLFVCAFLLHRLPHQNDGTKGFWMPHEGTGTSHSIPRILI